MKTEVTRNGRADDALTAIFRTMVHTMCQTHGEDYTRLEFAKILSLCAARVDRLEDGSVVFVLRVSSRKGLVILWSMFSSGELSRRLTEIFVTNELTKEDRNNIAIQVTISKSDYEQGCKFFEELQDDQSKGKRTNHTRMHNLTLKVYQEHSVLIFV